MKKIYLLTFLVLLIFSFNLHAMDSEGPEEDKRIHLTASILLNEHKQYPDQPTASSTISQQKSQENQNKEKKDEQGKTISRLIKDVKAFQAYEKDYVDIFKSYITPELINSIEKNIVANKKIISILKDLNENAITKDKALTELLWLRYSLVESRRSNALTFNRYRLSNQAHLVLFGPTAPEIYRSLTPDQQICARKSTDRYQLFNRIILGLTSIIDLRALRAQTKMLLRASPTLCAIIEDPSRPLGHPDETFILNNDSGEMSDWEYLMSIKPSHIIPTFSYSCCHKEKGNMVLNSYERQDYEPGWKNPYGPKELPYPQFLQPYSHVSVTLNKATANTSLQENTLQIKDIESRDKDLSEHGQIPKKNKKLNKGEGLQTLQSSKSTKTILKEVQTANQPAVVKETSGVLEVKERTGLNSFGHIQGFLTTDDVIIAAETTASLVNNNSTEPAAVETAHESPRPKGMRSFHNNQVPLQRNQFVINNRHTKILEKLFSPNEYSSVRFGDFATLWRSINGLNSIRESTGSSHKALLDQAGGVVTGVYSHNENEKFGKRTIKYIRDAFKQIGYNPGEI